MYVDHTFSIFDTCNKERKATFISLSKLLVENNNDKRTAIGLTIVTDYFKMKEIYEVQLLDSVFRNNSGALMINLKYRYDLPSPIVRLSNITFLQNFKHKQQKDSTINLFQGRFHLEFCRFIDNTAGNNLYSALVIISDLAIVTFQNCYYENSQTNTKAIAVYASPKSIVYFKGNNTFNLIALKTEQAIFMHMPYNFEFLNVGSVVLKGYQSLGIFCPRGYGLNAESKCEDFWSILGVF